MRTVASGLFACIDCKVLFLPSEGGDTGPLPILTQILGSIWRHRPGHAALLILARMFLPCFQRFTAHLAGWGSRHGHPPPGSIPWLGIFLPGLQAGR